MSKYSLIFLGLAGLILLAVVSNYYFGIPSRKPLPPLFVVVVVGILIYSAYWSRRRRHTLEKYGRHKE